MNKHEIDDTPDRSDESDSTATATRVVRMLAAVGLARGDRVAVLSAARPEAVATFAGLERAGLVAIPIDRAAPKTEIASALRSALVRLVFCDEAGRALVPDDIPVIEYGGGEIDAFDVLVPGDSNDGESKE